MTNHGYLKIGFTSKIEIPDGTDFEINERNKENKLRLLEGKSPLSSHIQVYAAKDQIYEDDEVVRPPIMDDWELISIDGEGFELLLNFQSPLLVSSDEEPDLLIIQIELADYEDENR